MKIAVFGATCLLLLLVTACDNPVEPDKFGSIIIVLSKATSASSDSTASIAKPAKPSTVDKLEVRVLKSDNTVVKSQIFNENAGVFSGSISVKAEDNLKVICIGTNKGVVERFGIDEDVDVKPDTQTDATISGWLTKYIPEIIGISPNPSPDGNFTITWNTVQNAATYTLEVADNLEFNSAATVYTGNETTKYITGKQFGSNGLYYYRVQATNDYGITSGWSGINPVNVAKQSYTISGTVTGTDDVTINLSGDYTDSQVVDDGGTYSFTVLEGTYFVRPQKSGYTFEPESHDFYSVAENQTQDFVATYTPITYTISGTIIGASDVTVTLGGDDKDSQVVATDGGSFSFTVDVGGNYTVMPSKSGYTFTPSSQTFSNVTSDQTQNFSATEISIPLEIEMVSIPAGSFRMGDISGDGFSNELPIHDVTISSFELGVYEVTQEQYQSVMGSNPSYFSGTNLPVERVSWYDAVKFCNKLSVDAGLTPCYDESSWSCDFSADGFRLPTEAEWEYACRAGTETEYYTGNADSDLGEAGWYNSNSSSQTHPVGQKTSNAFGLYDMHGNVWEWCSDWYGESYYDSSPSTDPTGPTSESLGVIRGGSWTFDAGNCRSAIRGRDYPAVSYNYFGFRVARGAFTPGVVTTNYTISGTITGASDVAVTLSGDNNDSQVVTTDGGSYSFTVNEGGSYTVTLLKTGYEFTPASQTFSNVTNDQTQDFVASQIITSGRDIVFQSDRDGKYQIYTMDADGSNLTRVTNGMYNDFSPSWSPDGTRIVFASDRDGNFGTANEIYVMDADGSNQTRLTNNPANDYLPFFSPDGTRIVFTSNYQSIGGFIEIYVMDTDGSNLINLTNTQTDDFSPSWSSDSAHITFESSRSGDYEIYVMDDDGSNLTNITNTIGLDRDPSWSPDGSQIAFYSERDGNTEIYVMDADGTNQTRITNNPANDYGPAWSPDSAQLVFYSDRDGNNEIYIMNADGSNQTRLTNNPALDNAPSW